MEHASSVLLHALLAQVRLIVKHVPLVTIYLERSVPLLVQEIWFQMGLSVHNVHLNAVFVVRLMISALSAMLEYICITISVYHRVLHLWLSVMTF